MAEAIVLGSGTSNGVPMLGVAYPPEFLQNPKNHRTRCSLLLRGPGGDVLVDCAPEMRIQLLRERVYALEAVVITHTHADHIMGMDDLRSYCIVQKREMPVYTLDEHMADIRRVFPYAFEAFPDGIEVPRFDLRKMPEVLEICGLRIESMVVEHGAMPVIALRVNDFAYVTDVSGIPPEAEAKLQGLDVLVLDAVRYKPHPNHLHYEAALEWSARLAAKKTYFTHLSHDYDHDRVNSELPQGIELAYDGLRVQI
jgi:phosphoribosyl 1,2-cyclic phosphate phosphodiesterase